MRSGAAQGYLLVAGSFLIMGLIGAAGLLVVLLGEHEEEGAASLEPAP
ncbi:MAG: hypothetical protein IMZ74_02955 [Actinobacteria bacterium]|nr:hypothetical protein [Actinomycetota bacterium]